uniref:Uncharacterized protein n=1 Tax=Physcomitrium patens TaxID=3218 RepID=A0A2K1IMV2_PHYPA|nr:hypothetical protein PHYPA_026922 [Physcomitrium patens]
MSEAHNCITVRKEGRSKIEHLKSVTRVQASEPLLSTNCKRRATRHDAGKNTIVLPLEDNYSSDSLQRNQSKMINPNSKKRNCKIHVCTLNLTQATSFELVVSVWTPNNGDYQLSSYIIY